MIEDIIETIGRVAMVACEAMSMPMALMTVLMVVATIESYWKNRDSAVYDSDGSYVSDDGMDDNGAVDRADNIYVVVAAESTHAGAGVEVVNNVVEVEEGGNFWSPKAMTIVETNDRNKVQIGNGLGEICFVPDRYDELFGCGETRFVNTCDIVEIMQKMKKKVLMECDSHHIWRCDIAKKMRHEKVTRKKMSEMYVALCASICR
jgi:hypothetical protein